MLLRSLKFKVFASVFFLVLASGTLVALLTSHYYWIGLRETMESEASSVAQRVAMQAAEKVLINDLVGIQRLLESHQAGDRRLAYLLLVRGGEVLGHTFPAGVPVDLLKGMQGKGPREPVLRQLVSQKGERFLDALWPIMQGRGGVLRLGLKEDSYLGRLHKLIGTIALITLAVLVIALGLCLVFARKITRPLTHLVDATERVAGGDWHSKVKVAPGLGEVARLAESFNSMVDRLSANTVQLEQRHRDLERANKNTRTSCEIIQEISAHSDAERIGELLLGWLRDSLACNCPLIVTALKDSDGLFLIGAGGVEILNDSRAVGDVVPMLLGCSETRFLDSKDLPEVLQSRIDPRTRRVSWVPILMPGRIPWAVLVDCPPNMTCDHCDIGFAEMVVTQASGSLLRALRRTEESLNLAGLVEREQGFCGMVGKDPKMRAVYQLIRDVAPTDATVMILGESGTGKEFAARAIHLSSPRSRHPFVVIDCSAYPATLLESELFGHEKGAFTGATRTKPGRFEQAQGGTVFLDEVGEIQLSAQTKLLRVLQTRCFERLGGEKILEMDVRILAATNKNLLDEVKQGRFREDLYYRLNVFPLNLPPLRQRTNDVPLLARRFLERCSSAQGKRLEGFSSEALRLLMDYDWPGNVRELENAVERAVILAKDRLVQPCDLPEEILKRTEQLGRSLESGERNIIADALDVCGWNKKLTADYLGISRTTLYRKIQKYRLVEPTHH